MYVSRDLGLPMTPTRKFRIGATVIAGQVVIWDGINGPGEITDPASVNSYADGVGISLEAGTYAAASPHIFVKCTYSPLQVVRSRASGGTANDTAHTTATLLTQDTASATVLADTAAADLDYSGGYLIGVTGVNKGHIRILTAQSDDTSVTVTVPFPASIAVGDTCLRCYSSFIDGVELTTTFDQVNNLLATTEALYTNDIGEFITVDVFVDGASCAQSNYIEVANTNPVLEFEMVFSDHAFNRVA